MKAALKSGAGNVALFRRCGVLIFCKDRTRAGHQDHGQNKGKSDLGGFHIFFPLGKITMDQDSLSAAPGQLALAGSLSFGGKYFFFEFLVHLVGKSAEFPAHADDFVSFGTDFLRIRPFGSLHSIEF